MLTNSDTAYCDHDHEHCVDDAVRQAQRLCEQQGQRFTSLRRSVLELIWSSHKPLGAYEVIHLLAEREQRRIMPPTVYRTLDFLVELGLVHKIASINAFIGCPFPERRHNQLFLLCRRCGSAAECSTESLANSLQALVAHTRFRIESQNIELTGLCPRCQEDEPASGGPASA